MNIVFSLISTLFLTGINMYSVISVKDKKLFKVFNFPASKS